MIPRRCVILIATFVALIGATVALIASLDYRDYMLRGYIDATHSPDLPFRIPRFGVNADLTHYDPDELAYHLELMQQIEVQWVRQVFHWDEADSHWDEWDMLVKAIAQTPGLELVAVLMALTSESPGNLDDFAQFSASFARRYGDYIDAYQIWDEPNIASGWGNQQPNPTHYTALLQATSNAIRQNDPGATIIAAALAPTTEDNRNNMSDFTFLDAILRVGAAEYVDVFAAKPYGFDTSPSDREVAVDHLNFSRIVGLREILEEHGEGEQALWASNWGWNALPDGWKGTDSIWGEVSTEQQTGYTLDALSRSEREWPWLGGLILQQWQPNAAEDDPQWGFALVDQNDQPTALWHALNSYDHPQAATNGLFPAQNPHTEFGGIWSFGDQGADIGWIEDSRFAFAFDGTDVALLLRQGDYVSHLYATIDGKPANKLPTDVSGLAYINLRSGDLQPQLGLVSVARKLEDEQHTLDVVADELIPNELRNRWPLVGFAVSSGDLATPYTRQIQIAGLATTITGFAFILAAINADWRPLNRAVSGLINAIDTGGQFLLAIAASLGLILSMFLTWKDGPITLFKRDVINLGLSMLTAGVVYVQQPAIILTLIAFLILFVLIYYRLETGLILILFWSPFFLRPIELYQFAFPVAEVLLWITFGAWLLKSLAQLGQPSVQDQLRRHLRMIDLGMIAFVVLGVISLSWTVKPSLATTELRTLIVQPTLFYLMLRTMQPNILRQLMWAIVSAGFAVASIGLYEWLTGEGIVTAEDGVQRLASVYGSPNNAALLLGRAIPFALALVLVQRDALMVIALTTMTVAIVLTQSAGALFLGVPVSVVLVLLFVLRRRAWLPIGSLIILGTIGLLIALQSPRFSRMTSLTDGTNFYRIRVWQSSANLLSDHPLTGVGLDQFLYYFRDQYIMPDAWEEPDLSHPHNFILDFWVRLGILGVIWWLFIQWHFWKTNWQHYRTSRDLPLVVGIMGCMANLLAHGLVDNTIFVLDLAYIFVFLLAATSMIENTGAVDMEVSPYES